MRQRYIVYHNGRAIGWVHAHNPMEAINRVAAITGKPTDELFVQHDYGCPK